MAKNTHSQEILTGTSDSYTEHELADPAMAEIAKTVRVQREMIGGDPELVGTPSLESSESDRKLSEPEKHNPPSPAQTMGSPSKDTGNQEDSIVDTTDGGGRKTTQPRSGRRSTKARASTVDDEFD